MSNAKFGAKEVMDVVLYDMETNKPVIQFDSLKTSSISVTLLASGEINHSGSGENRQF